MDELTKYIELQVQHGEYQWKIGWQSLPKYIGHKIFNINSRTIATLIWDEHPTLYDMNGNVVPCHASDFLHGNGYWIYKVGENYNEDTTPNEEVSLKLHEIMGKPIRSFYEELLEETLKNSGIEESKPAEDYCSDFLYLQAEPKYKLFKWVPLSVTIFGHTINLARWFYKIHKATLLKDCYPVSIGNDDNETKSLDIEFKCNPIKPPNINLKGFGGELNE